MRKNKSLVEFDELKENVINHSFIAKKSLKPKEKKKGRDKSLILFMSFYF